MFWSKMDEELKGYLDLIKSDPAKWEYDGFMNTYRMALPELSAVIRGRLISKDVVFSLKLIDPSVKEIGTAGATPYDPLYSELSEICAEARRQAGNPFIEEVLESIRRS